MNERILIVEDNALVATMLSSALTLEGCKLTIAKTGEEGLTEFQGANFDIVLLDIMLPGISGEDVIKTIRSYSAIPIIIISAKQSEVDKVVFFELGADDYIVKPFSVTEVMLRIKAVMNRNIRVIPEEKILKVGDIEMNLNTHEVFIHHKPVTLRKKEFMIFHLFITHPNLLLSKEFIFERVWQDEYMNDVNIINVHICKLRDKLRKISPEKEIISTVRGFGYIFKSEENIF
ncbi:MAG: response regulator transcription factor [Candidatus Izemoplasmatales bacterium]|jgi:two-component system response regulator RegX3|nr:response regulator transcription factor [Candidatus Izemoplasmatales bacterium]